MSQTEEELNKKLAEWAGITGVNVYDCPLRKEWRMAGEYEDNYVSEKLFTQSLDACFKWLVPKLRYGAIYFDKKLGCLATADDGEHIDTSDDKNSPALALCKAIEKLIDGDK